MNCYDSLTSSPIIGNYEGEWRPRTQYVLNSSMDGQSMFFSYPKEDKVQAVYFVEKAKNEVLEVRPELASKHDQFTFRDPQGKVISSLALSLSKQNIIELHAWESLLKRKEIRARVMARSQADTQLNKASLELLTAIKENGISEPFPPTPTKKEKGSKKPKSSQDTMDEIICKCRAVKDLESVVKEILKSEIVKSDLPKKGLSCDKTS